MKKRNIWLDIFKIFLSFLIICIHFIGESYWHHPLYRLSVPMFFMISGYFVYSGDTNKAKDKAMGSIKRTFKYLLIGFGIYIVFDFILCYVDGRGVGYYFTTLFYEDFLLEFLFLNRPITYHGYQLWFLIALLVVSIVHYFIVKFDKVNWYYIIIPSCLLIYLFFSGYMRLFQYTDMPIRYTRNAWFMGLPLFAIGNLMARHDFHKKNWYKYIYLGLGFLFFMFQMIERNLVEMEMYISTVLACICLLQFFLGLKGIESNWYYNIFGKNMPFYIYIFHVAVGVILGRILDFPNPYLFAFVILIVCILIYLVCFWIAKMIKKKVHN